MKPAEKNSTARILLSILGGVVAAIAIAFILSPLVRISFGLLWELSIGNLLLMFPIAIAWIALSMYCGGYTASRIALQNEYHITWVLIGIAIMIAIIYGNKTYGFNIGLSVISLSAGILGALAGCHSGIQYKERKKKDQAQLSR